MHETEVAEKMEKTEKLNTENTAHEESKNSSPKSAVQRPEEVKIRLEYLVKNETRWFHREHNKIVFIARRIPILVLGDHSPSGGGLLESVIKNLEDKFHSAIPLKDVSREGNHIHCERMAIRRYHVIVKLDGSNPGTVGENILIACDRRCQEKTFMFVRDTPENTEKVFSINHYFLYFPRTYFCKDDADMAKKATDIAIREAYRLAYLAADDPKLQADILNLALPNPYIAKGAIS